MRKSIFLLLFFTLFLNSCYVYRSAEAKKGESLPPIRNQLQPNQIYKIDVDQKTYVVKVVGWEKDSLIAKTNFKKDEKKSFPENKIQNVKRRVFSETRSNALTVLSYAAVAAGIIFLVK